MGLPHYSRNSTVAAILELLTHTFNVTSYFLLIALQFTTNWLLWILQKLSYDIPIGLKVYCGARDS